MHVLSTCRKHVTSMPHNPLKEAYVAAVRLSGDMNEDQRDYWRAALQYWLELCPEEWHFPTELKPVAKPVEAPPVACAQTDC